MSQHPGVLTANRPVDAKGASGLAIGIEQLRLPEPVAEQPLPTGSKLTVRQRPTNLKAQLRNALLGSAGLFAIAASGHFGWQYWAVGRFNVSTDNAYVKADNITIAPKVSGYIGEVLVGDNDRVQAGQVLARIDDRDFKVALQQADADVVAARAAITSKQAAIDAQQSVIEAARATIAADEADAVFARQEDDRYRHLAGTGFGSVQNAQKAASRAAASRAAIARDTASLTTALKQIGVLQAELAQTEAALARSQAVRQQAELNLSYTTIVAPADAVVGNRSLRVGQYVQAGTQMMSLVPTDKAYIVANYKETQLTNVHRGQLVEIRVDTYPGRVFRGRIDSLSPASGQEFALLPPDNATGNFTKVVQRIPVKINLDAEATPDVVLRPGMSVIATIDTKVAEHPSERIAFAPVPKG